MTAPAVRIEIDAEGKVSDLRPVRADARRNIDALLQAALAVFTTSGVDAPVREVANEAGVGIATLYRHFPKRSDLIAAVFRREIDACADAAASIGTQYNPGEALARWMQRYVDFIAAKRGLAAALHSGDPAFAALPDYFNVRLVPALRKLLDAATASGEASHDIEPRDLLRAVASLCVPTYGGDPTRARQMVALLVDGLRYGTGSSLVG